MGPIIQPYTMPCQKDVPSCLVQSSFQNNMAKKKVSLTPKKKKKHTHTENVVASDLVVHSMTGHFQWNGWVRKWTINYLVEYPTDGSLQVFEITISLPSIWFFLAHTSWTGWNYISHHDHNMPQKGSRILQIHQEKIKSY